MFGQFVKELRARQRLGLREFFLEHGHDGATGARSNAKSFSHPAMKKSFAWARQLGLKPNTDDWLKFLEFAAVDAGRIPDYIIENKDLTAHLPAFFRTVSGQKPSREDLKKLLGIIKRIRQP